MPQNTTKKATRAQIKSHNKRLVLKTIYDQKQISRAGLARLTRLTRPTVSSIVGELLEEGLVEEVGLKPSEGGKPATLLSVVENSFHLLGIDLGNSFFRGSVINLRGKIQHQVNLPVNDNDGQAALSLVYQLIDDLIGTTNTPLLGVGIGTPGLMNAKKGVVLEAVNLNWKNLPLANLLKTRYGLPVYIANDSQVAALAEYTFGNKQGASNLVVVKVGRGIGSGIVINGRLFYGDGFGAGEIGHVMVVENGEYCRCGQTGCLESVAGSRAIIKQAQTIAQNNPVSPLHLFANTPESIDTNAVLQAFNAGDTDLQTVITNVGRYLGIGIANLIGVLNIQQIIIAGSVAQFGTPLLNAIKQETQQRSPRMLIDHTSIELTTLGTDIVLLGAAALLLNQELGLV